MVIEPDLSPERIDRIVEECLREAAPALAERGASVSRQIDPRVPERALDRSLMKEAIATMMGEAIRALEPGRSLRVTVKANRNALMVALKSPGQGMDARRREAILGGDPAPGSLARARLIVSSHGGVLWANGMPGRGITWYLTLPAPRP